MFTIVNIIVIICKFYATVCPWLQDDTKNPTPKFEWRPIIIGTKSFSMLRVWVHIVLWCSFSLFHSVSGFLIVARKAVRRSSFAEALATWPNKYYWFRWLMSPENKNTSLESHLLVQIAIPFKIQYLFKKCFKVSTEKYAFLTTTNIILIFYFYCFEFRFYIL